MNIRNICQSLQREIKYCHNHIFLELYCYLLIYYFNEKRLSSFHDSPIYIAFKTPAYIYFTLIVNISIYFLSLLDLLLDWRNNKDLTFQEEVTVENKHNSLFEKAFMAVIKIVFG